jgi:predicted phosphodiesterase
LAAGFLASCVSPRIAPAGKATNVRFGIVTDSHYADVDARGSRPYRESLAKMKECVEAMNRERVDFLIELGDFKDQDDLPLESKTLSYLRRIEAVFAGFKGPRYHALGNHDHDSLSKEQFLAAAPNPGIPKEWSFYRFDVRGIRFLVLDANFDAKGEPYDHGRFGWEDCNVPVHELTWLRSELVAAPSPVIVFIHQQLDGSGAYYVRNAEQVRALLEQSGKVLAVFQGHRHEGATGWICGIPYYTLKGMIEGSGPQNNSYAIVEVDPAGGITVTGFRKADSIKLHKIK